MAVFTSKDWGAAKVTKIRASVQKRMNLAAPATDAQISDFIDDHLRAAVRGRDAEEAIAAALAGVADI